MKFDKIVTISLAAALLQTVCFGQSPIVHNGHHSTVQPPAHRGILSFLHKPKKQPVYGGPGQYGKGSPVRHHTLISHGPALGMGTYIGNKNTHVFHVPGDKGTLPAEKNRVYFKSAAAAKAAGYHQAK